MADKKRSLPKGVKDGTKAFKPLADKALAPARRNISDLKSSDINRGLNTTRAPYMSTPNTRTVEPKVEGAPVAPLKGASGNPNLTVKREAGEAKKNKGKIKRITLDRETETGVDTMRPQRSVKKYKGAPETENNAALARELIKRGARPEDLVEPQTLSGETGNPIAGTGKTKLQAHIEGLREAEKESILPGGRRSPEIGTNPGYPKSRISGTFDAASPMATQDQARLGVHASNFVMAHGQGKRAVAESHRIAFHNLAASGVTVPQGMEVPCSTPGCTRANSRGKGGFRNCEDAGGSCNIKETPSVGRQANY